MLRRNKSLSIIMALCLCLALLAPVFVAPPAAEAASTGSVVDYRQVQSSDTPQNLGVLKVEVTNFSSFPISAASPWIFTVSFPTKLADNYAAGGPVVSSGTTPGNINIVVPTAKNAFGPGNVNVGPGDLTYAVKGTFNVYMTGITDNTQDKAYFEIRFSAVDTENFTGPVTVNLLAGSSPLQDIVGLNVATVNVGGKTTTIAKKVRKITSAGDKLDNITIVEQVPGTIQSGETITVEMVSKGFAFATGGMYKGYWKFDTVGQGIPGEILKGGVVPTGLIPVSGSGDKITFTAPGVGNASQDKGMIALVDLPITVDEKVARVGQDIEIRVKGANVTDQTVVVGQYVDYLVNLTLDKSTELIAGRSGNDVGQVLGTFFMEEVAPGTLVKGRSILLELPAGLSWDKDEMGLSSNQALGDRNREILAGSLELQLAQYIDDRTMKLIVSEDSKSAEDGAKILFKNLAVDVSPSYRGDVTLKISGKAGAEGEVIVSKVIPMITMEGATPEVKLGIKEQKVADVVITESKADAIVDRESWASVRTGFQLVTDSEGTVTGVTAVDQTIYTSYDTALKFYLDDGFRFTKVPKVEVLEGDIVLELADVKITTPRSGQNLLIIPIRAGSYKTPAKIKISDIYLTSDRNAPTGDVILYAAETAADMVNGIYVSDRANAFNNTGKFGLARAAECAVATNTTVPPVENAEVGSGTFVIGSNLYTVNGVTRVMDVAPYIKSDRTYVPYRYLAYALGVAEEDVVWDQAAQTVTLTLGDTTVVATIGSTTLTVNGESVVMDVAPEIYEGRTMLPARWLAEALGATVGWDNASRTVVVEF